MLAARYTLEKRVAKTGGGEGFADVWKRGRFAWDSKSKGGNLKGAHTQSNETLENPPHSHPLHRRLLATALQADDADLTEEETPEALNLADQAALDTHITRLESNMREATKKFEFEKAANSATR